MTGIFYHQIPIYIIGYFALEFGTTNRKSCSLLIEVKVVVKVFEQLFSLVFQRFYRKLSYSFTRVIQILFQQYVFGIRVSLCIEELHARHRMK